MATPRSLADEKKLVGMGGNLAPHECAMRTMYATPDVISWIRSELMTLSTDGFVEGAATPKEQAAIQIRSYIKGDPYEKWMLPRLLRPHDRFVWELRTPDLRLFGWFYRKCVFILAAIAPAAHCKDHDLYTGYINLVCSVRDSLDLDEPKFETGGINDVF